MASIILDRKKLEYNYKKLNRLFDDAGVQWSVVSKMLCGNKIYLQEIIRLGIKQFCDARILNLKTIKEMLPDARTYLIKPPAKNNIKSVIRYADVSLNSSIKTLSMLSDEAVRQGKRHEVLIMVELGELREGVMGHRIGTFFEKALLLPNIDIIGLGANLTCLNGVLPDSRKLGQLVRHKEMLEEKFDIKLPYLSGGASVTIPLLIEGELPLGINHFRIGETLFFGTDVYNSTLLQGMKYDIFTLEAQILEVSMKPMLPYGEMGNNMQGHRKEIDESLRGVTSNRALVDVGLLDVDIAHIKPNDDTVKILGVSSDMLVVDLGENNGRYNVGDLLTFSVDYMGALRLMASRYVSKTVKE